METPIIECAATSIRLAHGRYVGALSEGRYADFDETSWRIGAHLDTVRKILRKEAGGTLTGEFSSFVKSNLEFDLPMAYAYLDMHLMRDLVQFSGIYFVQQGKTGPVKIGWTRNLPKRIDTFQVANSRRLHVMAVERGDTTNERSLHRLFRNERIRGEWFRASRDILDYAADLNRRRVRSDVFPRFALDDIELNKRHPLPEDLAEAHHKMRVLITREKLKGMSEDLQAAVLVHARYYLYLVADASDTECRLLQMAYGVKQQLQLTYMAAEKAGVGR